MPPQYSSLLGDVESGLSKEGSSLEFADRAVRLGFIRKVMGIVTVQLLITAVATAAFIFSPSVSGYVRANQWTFWTAFVGSLALILVLSFSETARRSHPTNLICLLAFTLCESLLVATISSTYKTDIVFTAAALTAGVTLCLTLYALQTKTDFTAAGGLLFCLLFCLIGGSILVAIFPSRAANIGLAAAGALLFSAYIVWDIQLMVGGHSFAISPDEYVLASINIYLDVINLFLQILRLLDQIRN